MEFEQGYIGRILEVATVSARLAGQRAMEELANVKTSIKNVTDVVTQADSICQTIIMDHVKEAFPDHGFIAEEGPEGRLLKLSPRGNCDIWWVIDPIDGTNNYAHKLLNFAVSVAVMHQGVPIVGVIFDPATESTWTAAKGEIPRLNAAAISASTAAISRFESFGIDNNFEAIGDIPRCVIDLMLRTRFRNMGTTALHLAYTASGGLIGMINDTPKLWDIAAGAYICECAGAKVTDMKGGAIWPMDLAAYDGHKCSILAAGPNAHADALAALKDYPVK
jgi:myo-inositol-1(or 4)-monophosphatase